MNNIVYAILPFLLFGAVLGLLLKGRFQPASIRAPSPLTPPSISRSAFCGRITPCCSP